MLSGHLSSGYVEDARGAGAKAYVAKGQINDLVAVMRHVLQGGSLFPSF
jgi:DNA-binding NarL/FixJ family response regulator